MGVGKYNDPLHHVYYGSLTPSSCQTSQSAGIHRHPSILTLLCPALPHPIDAASHVADKRQKNYHPIAHPPIPILAQNSKIRTVAIIGHDLQVGLPLVKPCDGTRLPKSVLTANTIATFLALSKIEKREKSTKKCRNSWRERAERRD